MAFIIPGISSVIKARKREKRANTKTTFLFVRKAKAFSLARILAYDHPSCLYSGNRQGRRKVENNYWVNQNTASATEFVLKRIILWLVIGRK